MRVQGQPLEFAISNSKKKKIYLSLWCFNEVIDFVQCNLKMTLKVISQ